MHFTCLTFSKCLSSQASLNRHTVTVYQPRMFRCEKYGLSFTRKAKER